MEKAESRQQEVLSRLGPSLLVRGTIESSEDMTIEGRVEGQIILHDHSLVITANAEIQGDVKARDVLLAGTLEGNIIASGKVTITSKASLTGDISAARVAVEEGARFKGSIKINLPSPPPPVSSK